VWLHHIELKKGEQASFQLHGPRAYLQSIHGTVHAVTHAEEKEALTCGDGAFIRDEANITLVADTPLRALLIDLPVNYPNPLPNGRGELATPYSP
jgi:redox-sensitive bicupin YhaK (pirin superfamily)